MGNFNEVLKKFKYVGIVVSVILVVLGILIMNAPVKAGLLWAWFLLSALFANGIYKLIRYFSFSKENRNGWMLADGIISSLLSLIILYYASGAPIRTAIEFVAVIGFLVGFYEIFNGINQLCSISAAKAAGMSTGWLIFIGIVNILCGIFVVGRPVISYLFIELVFGIYLLIFGVTTFIECVCIKTKSDK